MIPAMEHRFVRVLALVLVIVLVSVAGAYYAFLVVSYSALTVFSVISNLFPVWD
jgi:hypothetical protein